MWHQWVKTLLGVLPMKASVLNAFSSYTEELLGRGWGIRLSIYSKELFTFFDIFHNSLTVISGRNKECAFLSCYFTVNSLLFRATHGLCYTHYIRSFDNVTLSLLGFIAFSLTTVTMCIDFGEIKAVGCCRWLNIERKALEVIIVLRGG